jgi:nicotinate-nucleotide adenylyltransferase
VSRRADLALPPHAPGMTIGLFGGSFNPAHEGHRMASLTALRRLGLTQVWWLVTPGNPLKDNSSLPAQDERMATARKISHHPRIIVTGVEASFGTRYTADTLRQLKRRCPGVRFVWIMGSDNLAGFHRWQEWRAIARMMPLVIIDRPGSTNRAVRSKAGVALARHRLDETDGRLLARAALPAWLFVHGRRSFLSSTSLRNAAKLRASG